MSSEDRENAKISLLLRASRSMLGMNLKDFADVMGTSSATAGKWETADLTLKATTYMKLSRFLNDQGIEFDFIDDPESMQGIELVIKAKTALLDRELESNQSKGKLKNLKVDYSKIIEEKVED